MVKVKSVEKVTHDVLRIVTEKPQNYSYLPGQATEIAINKERWKKETRPFTFTGLPQDNHLEFTIKTYPSHQGVTNELLNLKSNDELIVGDAWGTIGYKGEGVFIAGGAGVTPFISIFRSLHSKNEIKDNKLIFANKAKNDIINETEFKKILGKNFINILSDEKTEEYAHGLITEDFLKQCKIDSKKYVYICGPPPMMNAIEQQLLSLNIEKQMIVKEEF
jgi:ferredoxin-NADP reductase